MSAFIEQADYFGEKKKYKMKQTNRKPSIVGKQNVLLFISQTVELLIQTVWWKSNDVITIQMII